MNVLGISCYFHDASATLVRDGAIVAAAEEERFTRKKHDSRFPEAAIRHCLDAGGLDIAQVDAVCFYEKPLRKLERLLATGRTWRGLSEGSVARQLSLFLHERLFMERVLAARLGYAGPVRYCDHHLAHAACAYFTSPFPAAALMTVDAVGEWASTVQFVAEGNTIRRLREIRYPHSLGMLYSAVTGFLGVKVNNDEYKVMGLASYGQPTYMDQLARVFRQGPDGSFRLNLGYFDFTHDTRRMHSRRFEELLGPPRTPDAPLTRRHMDLAASVQALTEQAMVALAASLHEASGGMDALCLAGGLALNCVANTRVLRESPFTALHVPPAAADGGGSMGAALYCYWHGRDEARPLAPHSPLLGPAFGNEAIEAALRAAGLPFQRLDDEALLRRTAELIARDQIVGWFQGRMEFGPRALGNRSILANATNPAMKDIVNSRIKFREDFRPFAPAVLAERAGQWFDLDAPSPYMLLAPQVRPGMDARIPAVTHCDNSARVQTVSPADNPRLHRLITAFEALTGVPVVMNTSFNIRGEPIVCTPQDACRCFLKTDLDFLVMGNYLADKGF
ncbi:carbamoyltransferase family protein [Desulfocurvus vexinensis]|uniref:carbamoyltransferase family protein n=1 Tax=Desulfocurvus vexinensis TaxID=399548 RepID=UPI0004BC4400|nr:carbamoyltransferase [Desulfocurvus vexinensis]